jgi:DNA polymerase elongation subunit (family B)
LSKPIYTVDVETDPFQHGRFPMPFACGLYGQGEYKKWWGEDCIGEMMLHIEGMPEAIIYAHNGGRFDFFYFLEWFLGEKMNIKNSRIIMSEMQTIYGKHEFRDSFAIMPFALGKYKGKTQKKKIHISLLENYSVWSIETREETTVRLLYQDVIEEYLEYDCRSLWELVTAFVDTFGIRTLTIGSAAMKELKKCHSFENLDQADDKFIRRDYYYGGRVECFEQGLIEGNFKVYDVNSMYPYSMLSMQHPIGRPTHESRSIEESTMLLSVTGRNSGAFPTVVKGKIMFDVPYGTFHVTRHEFDAAIECGLFDIERFERCINFEGRTSNFFEFVTKFYDLRNKAKSEDDEINSLFYKFVLNSAYGKFGQNPENYRDCKITSSEVSLAEYGWVPESLEHGDRYTVWSKHTNDTSRYNVATGASITGAARSILLRAIATAKRPLYCDTDSIICEELPLAKVDATELGAWKLESECTLAAIAGRKLYSLWNGNDCVKQANKGVAISAADIKKVCAGNVIQTHRDSPSFKLDGSYNFISRKVRIT